MQRSNIGENTRRILKERGLKHGVFAKKIGFSAQQFSDMLAGRRVIRDQDVIAIANGLEVTPNVLFGFADNHADRSHEAQISEKGA